MPEKIINGYPFIQWTPPEYTPDEMMEKSLKMKESMLRRRSIREIDSREVSRQVMENIIAVALSAPSGANKQPWTFCLVSNKDLKRKIRAAAEAEERTFYEGRASEEWLHDLAPLQTGWEKPFLETAPWLIVVFRKTYDLHSDGRKTKNYYVQESVGIACGFLIAAIHLAGLVTLTHTPSPMNFLQELLQRPENEKPYLLLPVGYAHEPVWVPDIQKYPPEKTTVWFT